ncbi:MAG: NfeD family protein [Chloroflexota bacterium]
MLVNIPDFTGPLAILIGVACLLIVISVIAVVRSQRQSPAAGLHTLVGTSGTARTAIAPEGTVYVQGELWRAVAHDGNLEPGTPIIVAGIEGLKLIVKRKEDMDG